jgi:hypothetical protein
MEKQQRRINAQYNEDRHEPETAINIIFDKHFGRYDKTTISRFTFWCEISLPLCSGVWRFHQQCSFPCCKVLCVNLEIVVLSYLPKCLSKQKKYWQFHSDLLKNKLFVNCFMFSLVYLLYCYTCLYSVEDCYSSECKK